MIGMWTELRIVNVKVLIPTVFPKLFLRLARLWRYNFTLS